MAVFAVYIKKQAQYFGETRTFGNTYHYSTGTASAFNDQEVAEEIAFAEQGITANHVQFVGWQSWGPTDGPAIDNVMREDGTFSNPGDIMVTDPYYLEQCILFSWGLSRSPTTNRKRWLRKFIRAGFPQQSPTNDQIRGAAALDQVQLDQLQDSYVTAVQTTGAGSYSLCTEDGSEYMTSGVARPYYYTRQIGR